MPRVTVVFIGSARAQREARIRRAVALTALMTFVVSFAWMLFLLPAYLGFALSVGSAVGWCIWLEHHPDPRDLAAREDDRKQGR